MNKLTTSLAALVLGTALANATNINSDLFLGFQQTGVSNDIVFDLGKATSFITDAAGSTTDLSSKFNLSALSVFNTASLNGSVYFGVAGTTGSAALTTPSVPGDTVFVGSPGVTVPQRQSSQTTLRSSEATLAGEYTPNIVTNYALEGTGDVGSYTTVAGTDGTYNGNFLFQTQAVFTGAGVQTLALYEVSPGTGNGSLLGAFALNDTTGNLSFTAASAPEPSTYLMMGMGLAVLAFLARRQLANNA